MSAGTLLIAEGTALPAGKQYDSQPFSQGWRRISNLDTRDMDELAKLSGWSFFFIAGVVESVAFGSDTARTAARAVRKMIAASKRLNLNCIEINEVAAKRFLAIPYTKVSARWRHIQASQVLSSK